MVLLDKFEQLDIDTPEDLEFARTVAAGLPANDPLLHGLSELQPASRIKLIVCDVDGCLTNGEMSYTESGAEIKSFHTRDGIAVQQAQNAGIEVAFLSSGFTSGHIAARAAKLGVKRVAVSREPKTAILKSWMQELALQRDEVAYLGDDVNDIEAMRLCGLTACPADAHPEVRKVVTSVLATAGGKGVLRDFWDQHIQSA
jgi:YrbI family 3-deoxy-D-manno-octulosonate 8-phosphate phosphatase